MGNLTANAPTGTPPAPSRTFSYDAENRQVQAVINLATTNYTYDVDGRRVTRSTPGVDSQGNPIMVVTTFVYDAEGQLAQEYSNGPATDSGTSYLTTDHLGSTRLITDGSAGVKKRFDYLPFGEELLAGTGGRTAEMGYNTALSASVPDIQSTKFTSKERDAETGLDYFNVRYFSGSQGRFTSPDPLLWQDWQHGDKEEQQKFAELIADPQQFNLYAYVGNNPLSYTDPTGESWWSTLIGVGLDIAGFFTGGTTTILGTILTTAGTIATGGSIGGGIIGDISGGVNSGQPWNEQIPGLGGGSLNTGGTFGSGNTDPFVFSILQANGSAADVASYNTALQYLMRDPGLALIIQQLQASKTVYRVNLTKGVEGVGGFNRGTNEILWDPHASAAITGGCVSPAFVLGHELAHAQGWDSGKISYVFRELWPAGAYGNREEQRVITGPETAAARTLGEPMRQNHIANPAYSPNPTSRTCQ